VAFAPVDYGPQVQPDTQGVRELEQQQEAVFRDVRQLGSVIEGGAQAITQGMLHTQALKATAAVKEKQAQTLEYIDSNPYVAKTDLQQRMSPEDYTAWHASLGAEYKDAEAVPMYTAAGSLFDSEAKQARASAGQLISLPGWRGQWDSTEKTESSTIRERYVNRLAADQMIADQRSQTLMAIDKMVDGAVKPEDIAAAAKAAETSPWLKPAERRYTMEKALVAKDSFVARQAMLGGDTEVMAAELTKLKSDKSAELYPDMNVKQRLDLANQLGREHAFKFAKDTAEKQIVGPNVDENGKVDRTAIAKALAAYNGPNKEDVTKAVKIEEDQKLDIFGKQNAEIQQSILRAGQNPLTGRFSYAKAMKDPEARKAAVQLNRDAPGLLTALSREEQRNENIDAKATALERREAKAQLIQTSGENLDAIHKAIDDPAQSDTFKSMTAAQFDSQLYNREMTETDRQKARTAFKDFQKNGGKPDERAIVSVKAEVASAAKGDSLKTKQLLGKYGSALLQSAHQFIRANPTLPPDKMTDALRLHIKGEMLSGKVLGTGTFWDDSARRIEWESNAKFAGKDFKLDDGTIVSSKTQRIRMSKNGQTGTFAADDVAGARADGWK
jgi:hypothetical protein